MRGQVVGEPRASRGSIPPNDFLRNRKPAVAKAMAGEVVRGRTEQIKLRWSFIYEGPGRGRAESKPGFDSSE